ncbi:MAG: Cof-type HAD-IIB family hydrolase [Olsenella sp.]|nr:Cof-type HAD-IIB family hydrolase [Olsenella sp.]
MPLWNAGHPIKAAFFDADGTLLSFRTHQIPDSAQIALSELRRAGVKCFLATGRPPYQVDEIPIDNLEAFILFNGQFILNRDEILYRESMDPTDIARVVEQVQAGLYDCLFMEAGRCYVSGHNERVRAIEEHVNLTFEEGDIEEALHNEIYQLNAYLAPGETDVLARACSNIKMTRWSPNFVDVFPRGGGKARAVRRVLEMYGISPEEAIAFGDGGNDIGMLDAVGTSVALGNANPEVKEMASFVTEDVDHDGVYNACVRLGLVDA